VCGRYALGLDPEEVARGFDAEDLTGGDLPAEDFNVAPTKPVPVVVHRGAGRLVGVARWGLVPWWSADTRQAARRINARAETVATRPAFRDAYARRRCLVPASGWYEWAPREDGTGRRPYYLTPTDGSVLAFAGLWEVWGEGADRLRTCAVVTTAAPPALSRVHSRMPLVLPRERWASWLGEPGGPAAAADLLAPTPARLVEALEVRPVGAAVGDVRSAGRSLTSAVPDPDAALGVPHRWSDPLPLGPLLE